MNCSSAGSIPIWPIILGNLVSRTVAMVNKYFGGEVPAPGEKQPVDEELISLAEKTPAAVAGRMDGLHVADALDEIWTLARRSNKYIDETTPWVLGRDEANSGRPGHGAVQFD